MKRIQVIRFFYVFGFILFQEKCNLLSINTIIIFIYTKITKQNEHKTKTDEHFA